MLRYLSAALTLILLSLVPCVPLPGLGGAPPEKPDQALRDILEPIRKKHDLPALAAAFVRSKGLVAAAAVGVRRRGTDIAVTADDQFHLGSDTKPMTAFLIAWLIEQGMLDWDTPLARIFPELAKEMTEELKKVTPVHLLTHHAGLPENYPGGWENVPFAATTRGLRLEVLKTVAGLKLEHKPGEKYQYSNLGYTLAGAVAEKVAGVSWEDLIRKRLFDPLKMASAGFGPMGELGKTDQPYQHGPKGRPIAPGPLADNPPVMGPAGRVHCSLPDWARFVADHLRGSRGGKALLKPATYRKMDTTPFQDEFYTVGGWTGQPKSAKQNLVLGHDGSNTMNYCTALLVPAEDFAILVAANQGGEAGQNGCLEARRTIRKKLVHEKK
jgi:CubicO group peptidase (beta-lactamase class C family)